MKESNLLLYSKGGLKSSEQVRLAVAEKHGIELRNDYIAKVLRNDVGLRYKVMKKVPFLGNMPRCLILRQLYAKFMIQQLEAGKRIINIDQSWLSDMNF